MEEIRSSIPRPRLKTATSALSTHRRRKSAPSTPGASPSFLPIPSSSASRPSSRSSRTSRDSGIAFVLDGPRTPQSALPVRLGEAQPRAQIRTPQFACTSGDLLTPTSTVSRRNHEKSELSPSVRNLHTFARKSKRVINTSPYMNPHVSDACTAGSLVHWLHPCGHKVITGSPEPCASNCRREYTEKTSCWANAIITQECFVCATCVDVHNQEHRYAQLQNLEDRFARTEARMGTLHPQWLKKQITYAQRVLDNDIEKQQKEFAKLGRACLMIPGEPHVRTAEPAGKLATASMPWPPHQSPKGSRSSGTSIPVPLLSMLGSAVIRGEHCSSSKGQDSARTK